MRRECGRTNASDGGTFRAKKGRRPSAGGLPGWPRARRYGASQGARRPRWLIHATVPCGEGRGGGEDRGQIARGGGGRVGATRTAHRAVREGRKTRRDEISTAFDATRGCGPGGPRRRIPPRRARERRAPPTPRASRGSLASLACRWTALGECGSPEKLRTFLLRRPKRKTAHDGARRAWRKKILGATRPKNRRFGRLDSTGICSARSPDERCGPRIRPGRTTGKRRRWDRGAGPGRRPPIATPSARRLGRTSSRRGSTDLARDTPSAPHPARRRGRRSGRGRRSPPGLPPAPSRPWRHPRPPPPCGSRSRKG